MNKYVKAALSNSIFFVFNTIFFLAITAIALNIMGEEFFGLWIILNSILLFSNVGTFGMAVIINKYASEAGEDALPQEDIFSTGVFLVLPMATMVALFIIVFRSWIAKQLGLDGHWSEQFQLALFFTAISIFPQFLGRVPVGYLLAHLRNDLVRGIEFGLNISLWTGAVVLANYTHNLAWMALWGFIILSIGMIIYFSQSLKTVSFRWKFFPVASRKMLSFSTFNFIESLGVNLFQLFDRILVGFVLGPAAAGIYAVATSVGLRIVMIAGQFTEVLVPYSSRKYSLGENQDLYNTFRQVSQVMSLLTGFIAALLILWMDIILSLWISPEYALNYSLLFRLIVFAYFFISLVRSGHQTLVGMGKVSTTSIIYLSVSLFMLVGIYILAQKYGLTGAALANFSMGLLFVFNILVYKIFNPWNFPWREMLIDNGIAVVVTFLIFEITFFPLFNQFMSRILITVLVITLSLILLIRKNIVRTQLQLLYIKFKSSNC